MKCCFSGFEIAERVDIARAIETRVFITEYLVRYISFYLIDWPGCHVHTVSQFLTLKIYNEHLNVSSLPRIHCAFKSKWTLEYHRLLDGSPLSDETHRILSFVSHRPSSHRQLASGGASKFRTNDVESNWDGI